MDTGSEPFSKRSENIKTEEAKNIKIKYSTPILEFLPFVLPSVTFRLGGTGD